MNTIETNQVIEAMNRALAFQRMHQKELYEHLIAKGVIAPNSEREFKSLYEYARQHDLIDKTRVKNWNKKRGKLPRYFTKPQLIQLFDRIDRPKDAIACFLALMGGLRINEVCRLKLNDIDFDNHRLFIRDSKNPNRMRDNYGRDRYVDFDAALDPILKYWIEIIGNTSEWLLPSDRTPDRPLTKKAVHERFRGYLKEAGLLQIEYTLSVTQRINGKKQIKKVNRHRYYFHCLRHTMACIIYDKTGDIYAVNKFLGHRQLDTTTIYAQMTDHKMKQTITNVFQSLHQMHPPKAVETRTPQASANNPLELLERHYVLGEITEQEFLRKKQVLRANELKRTIELEVPSNGHPLKMGSSKA